MFCALSINTAASRQVRDVDYICGSYDNGGYGDNAVDDDDSDDGVLEMKRLQATTHSYSPASHTDTHCA